MTGQGAGSPSAWIFGNITAKLHNFDMGFYPFVIDLDTSVCVAHGGQASFAGKNLTEIFTELNLAYSSAGALHQRFIAASSHPAGGDWVQYFWPHHEVSGSKISYVVPFNTTNPLGHYYLGVGYEDTQLPPDLPCQHTSDAWCSINNVRSLVGKAQMRLMKADSLANFEEAAFALSYHTDQYEIPGGFYIFVYNFNGPLMSHGRLHQYFGNTLATH